MRGAERGAGPARRQPHGEFSGARRADAGDAGDGELGPSVQPRGQPAEKAVGGRRVQVLLWQGRRIL